MERSDLTNVIMKYRREMKEQFRQRYTIIDKIQIPRNTCYLVNCCFLISFNYNCIARTGGPLKDLREDSIIPDTSLRQISLLINTMNHLQYLELPNAVHPTPRAGRQSTAVRTSNCPCGRRRLPAARVAGRESRRRASA